MCKYIYICIFVFLSLYIYKYTYIYIHPQLLSPNHPSSTSKRESCRPCMLRSCIVPEVMGVPGLKRTWQRGWLWEHVGNHIYIYYIFAIEMA